MKQKDNDWKQRLGMVYSTNPDFAYETHDEAQPETLTPRQQKLRVQIDRRGRNGKTATLITGFVGTDDDLKALAKQLKTHCGVGGSARDGEILIQGDQKTRIVAWLQEAGYTQTK